MSQDRDPWLVNRGERMLAFYAITFVLVLFGVAIRGIFRFCTKAIRESLK